jgi:spermidine synthase
MAQSPAPSASTRALLGVGLVSLSTLLTELLLTRIFSVSLFYHFAFMVISLALFGLGLAGVVLFLRPARYGAEHLHALLSRYSRLFAASTVLSLLFVLNHTIVMGLDVAGLSRFTAQHFFQFLFLYAFASLPFFFGGMVVSLALFHLRARVATLYFFDLAGASLACLLLDPLLRALGAPTAVLLAAALAAIAAVVFGESETRARPAARSIVLALALVASVPLNLWLEVVELGNVKFVNHDFLVFSKWNAISRIEVQKLPSMPYYLTIDALAATQIQSLGETRPEHTGVTTLVHVVRTGGRVLIIGPGGGIDVQTALKAHHREIVLAEINPIILEDVMGDRFKAYSGSLYQQPGVHGVIADGRSYVRRSREQFDVIQATLVDTWAATGGGAFALTENHLYTVEAFEDYYRHLTPTGIVTMTRWAEAQSMEFVRLGSLARAALDHLGVPNPGWHFFAASAPASKLGTLLVKKTPFNLGELRALHVASQRRGFLVNYSPVGRYNNPLALVLGSPDPAKVWGSFPIDIRPVHDDRPFFFYTVRPELLLKGLSTSSQLPLNSFSAVVLVALLGIVLLLVIAGIVVPLALARRQALAGRTGSKLHDLAYFIALGTGFILVEIGLMQRFALYLGHPVHSLRVVLFALLLASGVGSLASGRVRSPRGLVRLVAGAGGAIVLLAALHALALGGLLDATMPLTLAARAAIAAGLVALPALAMGMMLPTGIRLVSGRHAEIIPWAWGLNGAASVLGSVLAMVVAVHLGFRVTLLVGAAFYVLALVTGLRRPSPVLEPPPSVGPAPDPPG